MMARSDMSDKLSKSGAILLDFYHRTLPRALSALSIDLSRDALADLRLHENGPDRFAPRWIGGNPAKLEQATSTRTSSPVRSRDRNFVVSSTLRHMTGRNHYDFRPEHKRHFSDDQRGFRPTPHA